MDLIDYKVTRQFSNMFRKLENESGEINEDDVWDLVHFYGDNRTSIHPKPARDILYHDLPRLCFRRHIENSFLISEVLLSIHALPQMIMSHLVMFLTFNAISAKITLPDEELKRRQRDGKKSYNFLEYFLHHCNVGKMLFDDKRIVELIESTHPIMYGQFFLFSDPKSVLTLLQFGLRFDADLSADKKSKIHTIFCYVLNLVIEQERSFKLSDASCVERLSYERRITFLQNFYNILKTAYNPHLVIHKMILASQNQRESAKALHESFSRHRFPIAVGLLPSPSNLKHLARYAIRDVLFKNWNLPYAIYQLNLDEKLANYVNLMEI